MKRILIPLILLWALELNAQNYLITFAGSGESATVSTVKVENLIKGTSLELNGSDILQLTGSTGIHSDNFRNSGVVKVYPNPVNESSVIEIDPPEAGNATVTIYEMTGKALSQTRFYLDAAPQDLKIDGMGKGFYLVDIRGNNYNLSGRLVGRGQNGGTISITMIGNSYQSNSSKKTNPDNKGTAATVTMNYTTGDRLIFTGSSGNYKTLIPDIPSSDKTITFNFIACTDGGGNHYPIVQIGSAKGDSGTEEGKGIQTWMTVNLKTDKFNDGTSIPLVTDATAWLYLTGPGYCWYNNSETGYKDIYGALYNWNAVSTGKLCPAGWRVASHDDWTAMENYLISSGYNYDGTTTGNKIAKALSSPSEWISNTQPGAPGNTDYPEKINATGFSALPGGYRVSMTGAPFYNIGQQGMFWTSTEKSLNSSYAYFRRIQYNTSYSEYFDYNKKMGMAVRCIKN